MKKKILHAVRKTIVRPLRALKRRVLYTGSSFHKKIFGVHSLNIGGGPDFIGIGWLNLEVVKSSFNPFPFELTAECLFPVKDESIKTVYSSHCLEHLDTKTVKRVLAEVFRVLKKDGSFIIKIPDFDSVLEAWRREDRDFFNDATWGYASFKDTWKNRQVSDVLDNRASMIFCGFWNSPYGDYYAENITKNVVSYHGPAVVSADFLQRLKQNHTPSQISAALCHAVMEKERDYFFNHRNAWSHQELQELLSSYGFRVLSLDKNTICSKFSYIPAIKAQKNISMYFWMKKNG